MQEHTLYTHTYPNSHMYTHTRRHSHMLAFSHSHTSSHTHRYRCTRFLSHAHTHTDPHRNRRSQEEFWEESQTRQYSPTDAIPETHVGMYQIYDPCLKRPASPLALRRTNRLYQGRVVFSSTHFVCPSFLGVSMACVCLCVCVCVCVFTGL